MAILLLVDSRRAVVSLIQKNVCLVLVNCLREACPGTVVKVTDCPDMTSAVYRGHKATNQTDVCECSLESEYSNHNIMLMEK